MIEVEIEPADEVAQVLQDPSSADVVALVERRRLDDSTTLTVSDTSDDGRQLLVALSGGRAFVGLVFDDQQYQLTRQPPEQGEVEMSIGGLPTFIAGQYAVETRYAARAVAAFIDGDPLADAGLEWSLQ
jgi:hypothetical protein